MAGSSRNSNRNRRKRNSVYVRRKRRARAVGLVLFVLLALVVLLIIRVNIAKPYESIDLAELSAVEYGGYNTHGTAEIVIDNAKIDELLAKVKQDYSDATFHNTKPNTEDYIKFRKSLEFSLDKYDGLSNGSVILLSVDYDKELADAIKIEVTNTEREYQVGGLPTVTTLTKDQLFENLNVSFEGVSPNLTLLMSNVSDNPFISRVSFEIVDPKETYAEGDIVKIRANFTQDLCDETQYVVDTPSEECIKEYEVSSGSKYIDDASDLPDSIIDEAVEAGKKAFKDANEYGVRIFCEANLVPVYINKKATFEYGTPKLVSAYFKTIFPEKAGDISYDYNDLDVIYSVVLTQADGVSCTAYAAVRFSNIIKNSDGSYTYDFSDPKILSESYFDKRVKKNVTESYANTHDIEKVR